MHLEEVDTVGVVGAGTMGNGIAQVAAMAGYDVVMRDLDRVLVPPGLRRSSSLRPRSRFVSKEKLTAATARITGTTEMDDLADAASSLRPDGRRGVPQSGRRFAGAWPEQRTFYEERVTFASWSPERPELVLGLHFMNPVPIMKGVEVVRGEKTDDDVVAFAHDFAEALGKETWESDDKPGFVTNRILMPWLNEGIRAYDEGVAARRTSTAA